MKKIKLIMIFTFFSSCYLFAEQPSLLAQDSALISLGPDCEIALYLRQFNLRRFAFPFDWVRSYNFEKICFAISDKLTNFLNKDHLVSKINAVNNPYYGIEFVHDFPTVAYPYILPENGNNGVIVENYLDFLDQVKDKYQARLERFVQVLTANNPIFFFRTHINPNQAQYFVNFINLQYPNLVYQLVVVHDKKEFNYDWNINHVKNFYISERDPKSTNRWFYPDDWKNIFGKLGLLV